jgi:hypothetical protein
MKEYAGCITVPCMWQHRFESWNGGPFRCVWCGMYMDAPKPDITPISTPIYKR